MEKNKFVLPDFLRRSRFLMKLMILLILISLTSAAFNYMLGQQPEKVISGLVTGTNNEPIPGVTVMVKGTTIGTITDAEGKYSLSVPVTSKILVFSFIGMASGEVAIGTGAEYNVTLSESTTGLEEIVVVGYGTQRKASVVGAITQVNDAALVKSGNTNITNAISGKLSGVLTIQSTGEPGKTASEIIVRGLSSWNTSAPLVLVDGVERDFSKLDPNEINTISVLKDASATAVFGAKGANGVIIVTTKRGSLGRPKMDFSAAYGVATATRVPEHISASTTLSMLNVAYMNERRFTDLVPQNVLNEYINPSSRLNTIRYPDNDWFKMLAKKYAPTFNANFNIRGGTRHVKYFGTLGYLHDGDFFKGYQDGKQDTRFWYERFNYRANLDFEVTRTTILSLNVGGETGINNQPSTVASNTVWQSLYFEPECKYPAYFPEWVLEEVPDLFYPDATGTRMAAPTVGQNNPYYIMNNGSFNRYQDSQLFTDILLDQKLDFILKGLSFKGKFALSTYFQTLSLTTSYSFPQYQIYYERIGVDKNGDGRNDQNPWYRSGEGNEVYNIGKVDLNVGGLQGNFYYNTYYEMSLNYANSFGKHSVTGLALFNRQKRNDGTAFPYYNEALVGRATYDYANKYLMEVNIGYTGSERFAPGNRFGFFPSAAVGWVISEENFFRNSVPWMNKLKLRYSDGIVGSDYAANRWLYISNFSTSGGYIVEDPVANEVAQWEEARKKDLGIEVGLFKNLFSFTVDLFDEKRTNMLLPPQSVTMVIGHTFKERNLGSLKKHGIEVEAEFNKSVGSNLNYFVKGIFGFNENRILYKDDLPYAPDYTKAEGKPLGAQLNGVMLTGSGYYTSIDDIHNNVAPLSIEKMLIGDYKYLDYNADGKVLNTDLFPIKGNLYPPITYSFQGGFTYKKFDFSFMFQGNSGKYVDYNLIWECEFARDSWIRVHKSQLDYWTPDNQDAPHSTLHFPGSSGAEILSWGGGDSHNGYAIRIPDRLWRNADYLRLKEIYAAYTLNTESLKNSIGISNLQFYFTANNLLTFTNLIEGDPERKDFVYGFYPIMTTMKFGLRLYF